MPHELSAILQDKAWASLLKKIAIALLLMVSGLGVAVYYVVVKVDEQLQLQIESIGVTITLTEMSSPNWWSILSPLVYAIGVSIIVLLGCKIALDQPRFLVKVSWLVVTMIGLLLVVYPAILMILSFDCDDCENGTKLKPWLYIYSILFFLAGGYKFLQFCTVLEEEHTGIYQFFDLTKFVPLKESGIPIIGMLVTMRRLTQGILLFLSIDDVVDVINRVHNRPWVEAFSNIFLAYFLGTLFTFMSLIAHGCPSALEPKLKIVDKFWRASWTTIPSFLYACGRCCLLGYFYFLAYLQDAIATGNRNQSSLDVPDSPFLVTVWGYLLFALLCFIGFLLFVFIIRPQMYHACAKHGQMIAERERILADDDEGDLEMRTARSSRSRASTVHTHITGRLENPALL